MKEYVINQGADCLVAVDETGFAKQIVDMQFALKSGGPRPGRLDHLRKLVDIMQSTPEAELPKTVTDRNFKNK